MKRQKSATIAKKNSNINKLTIKTTVKLKITVFIQVSAEMLYIAYII